MGSSLAACVEKIDEFRDQWGYHWTFFPKIVYPFQLDARCLGLVVPIDVRQASVLSRPNDFYMKGNLILINRLETQW